MFADVIFPLRLAPLTYKVPEDAGIAPSDLKGKIVRAPLKNRRQFGLVIDVREADNPVTHRIKEIISIHDTFASGTFLQFLKWLSEYYLTPMGLALKSSFFSEAVADLTETKRREIKKKDDGSCKESYFDVEAPFPALIVDRVIEHIQADKYSTLLYHAPNVESEYFSLLEILKKTSGNNRGYIVIVPETGLIERIAPAMGRIFGDRLSILHSKLGKKERAETIRNILKGKTDVVLGTRSAALAPLPKLSFLAVLDEQSPSYKGEEGLHYNARDAAVMRGFIEKKSVLISSLCPSLESVFNVRRGKYTRLNTLMLQTGENRPRIKIVTFKTKKQSQLSLAPEVITHARSMLQKKEQVLFMVGRKGYSLVRCDDCGHIESCLKCDIPMFFYKSSGMLKCHHCGGERRYPDHCGECRGFNMQSFSAGTERVREEVSNLLKSDTLLIEKTKVSLAKSDFISKNPNLSDFVPLLIGTSLTKRKICPGKKYSAAVLMNIDLLMAQPDFRAYERAFQEMVEVSQMVKTDGYLLIQTKSPGSKMLKCLKNYDFKVFHDLELAQRKDLDYPPYCKMIVITVFGKRRGTVPADIWPAIRGVKDPAVTILGPIEVSSKSKSYGQGYQMLLKSRDNSRLHEIAKALLKNLESDRKIKVAVDVDPFRM